MSLSAVPSVRLSKIPCETSTYVGIHGEENARCAPSNIMAYTRRKGEPGSLDTYRMMHPSSTRERITTITRTNSRSIVQHSGKSTPNITGNTSEDVKKKVSNFGLPTKPINNQTMRLSCQMKLQLTKQPTEVIMSNEGLGVNKRVKTPSIIRVVHNRENPFAQLSKQTIWDKNLSLRAVGLWTRCLCRPDDWEFNMVELVKKCKEGRHVVSSAMKELMQAGYGIRIQYRFVKNGRYVDAGIKYVFFEFPATEQDKLDQLEIFKKSFQQSNFQNPGIKDSGDQQLQIYILTETEEEEKQNTTTTPPNPKPENHKPEQPKPTPVKPETPKDRGGGVASRISFNRKTKSFDGMTPEILALLHEAFPGVNIQQQLKEMTLWLMANPHRQGTQPFITKWLKKSMQELPKPYVREEDPVFEVDPEMQALMEERDARIQRELKAKRENQNEG